MIKFDFENEKQWYLEFQFEKIKEFRATGIYSIVQSGYSDGYVGIHFEKSDFEKPQLFQEKSINYFLENQEVILNALCEGIIKYYPKLMEIYEISDFDEEFGFPELKNINDVKKIIGIGNIHVLEDQKDGYSYLGFECGCPWDTEHGLGVIMHKERVIDVESADIAFSSSKEVRKDNGTYTEEERLKDEEWEKELAERIASYEREQEEIQRIEEEKLKEIQKIEDEEWNKEVLKQIHDYNEYIQKKKLAEMKKTEGIQNKKWWQFWI
jgi:hypothetical protein